MCNITLINVIHQGGPTLHSCGPLFKIIRVCGPQSAKNTYFVPKSGCSLKKKKGLHLESVSKIPILAQNRSVLQKKITAACDR